MPGLHRQTRARRQPGNRLDSVGRRGCRSGAPPCDLPESTIRALASEGLGAIEVDGPGFSNSKSRRLRAWADRLGLAGSAGSDFHAADRPSCWVGAITTSRDDLERLRKARQLNATEILLPNPQAAGSNEQKNNGSIDG